MGEIEYLDLVDENDNVIGKEDRNVIYKNNWRNFRVINIMIFTSDNKIVVPKRSGNRRVFPNCYDCSVGGHVSSGETYEHHQCRNRCATGENQRTFRQGRHAFRCYQ